MSIKPINGIPFVYRTISAVVKSTCLCIVLESSSIHHQKVVKAFNRYSFTIFLNKVAIQKSDWTKVSETVGNTIPCQISNAFTATLLFILQTVLIYIQLRSTQKQISKFRDCGNFIQYTKKYRSSFWTKQT